MMSGPPQASDGAPAQDMAPQVESGSGASAGVVLPQKHATPNSTPASRYPAATHCERRRESVRRAVLCCPCHSRGAPHPPVSRTTPASSRRC